VPTLVEAGVEADDLIASCAMEAVRNGHTVTVLTSDRDLLQLLDTDGVQVWFPVRGGKNRLFEKWNRERFEAEYGFVPDHFPDYKALRGDPSDNIPGLPGIGEKTAMKLIADFGALEAIYEAVDSVKPDKLRLNLVDNRDNAFLYRRLVRLKRDCEAASQIDWHAEYPIRLDSHEFRLFSERLGLKRYIK